MGCVLAGPVAVGLPGSGPVLGVPSAGEPEGDTMAGHPEGPGLLPPDRSRQRVAFVPAVVRGQRHGGPAGSGPGDAGEHLGQDDPAGIRGQD